MALVETFSECHFHEPYLAIQADTANYSYHS